MTYPFHTDARNTKCDKTEITHQVGFRSQMRMLAPQVILVGIPNAGRRTRWEQRERTREGMVPGFPDMLALHDGRVAALEFKSGTGTLAPQQIDTLNRLVRQDIPVGVFRSADTAVDWLRNHWPNAFTSEVTA